MKANYVCNKKHNWLWKYMQAYDATLDLSPTDLLISRTWGREQIQDNLFIFSFPLVPWLYLQNRNMAWHEYKIIIHTCYKNTANVIILRQHNSHISSPSIPHWLLYLLCITSFYTNALLTACVVVRVEVCAVKHSTFLSPYYLFILTFHKLQSIG